MLNSNEIRAFDNPLFELCGISGYRHDSEEDASVTITGTAYEEFVSNKRFILTMQEDLIVEDDIEEELEVQEAIVPAQTIIEEDHESYTGSEVDPSKAEVVLKDEGTTEKS